MQRPRLTIKQILTWADAYYRRTGRWPTSELILVHGARDESWREINSCLVYGGRGLKGGSSLDNVLAKHRNVTRRKDQPRLKIKQILAWADAYHKRTGKWPMVRSGPIQEAPGENWRKVDNALILGLRGLPGGSSLPKLLAKHRGVRNKKDVPILTIGKMLSWADAHHRHTGKWPTTDSGPVQQAPGETWSRIHGALLHGRRGLPKGGSLVKLLAKHRGRRNRLGMPKLSVGKILEWADAHYDRTGSWPTKTSGPIHGQKHETWDAIDSVLTVAGRGLRQRGTLAQLLAKHRNVSRGREQSRLSVSCILDWADAHFEHTGEWPTPKIGAVPDAPGEVWSTLDVVLRRGGRGLPSGSSLSDILRKHRNVTRRGKRTRLTMKRILRWADTHHTRNGRWPTTLSGPILGAPGENWSTINQALRLGLRGLGGNSSLRALLVEHRHIDREDRLTLKQILAWADKHHARTGSWPAQDSGPVPGTENETWSRIDHALRHGTRGLAGGSSVSRLLKKYRNVRGQFDRPPLTIKQILHWADEHYARTGEWPIARTGRIPGSDGDTWFSIQGALNEGCRGLPGGMTLSQVLAEHRDVPNPKKPVRVTMKQVLEWADAHKKRTGEWPHQASGPIHGVTDPRDWMGVERALALGIRGLRGGTTLARVLDKHRGVRNTGDLPPLTIGKILKWADHHRKRTRQWPHTHSGSIRGIRGETWLNVNVSLMKGLRGLPDGTTLANLLEERRGARHRLYPPPLTLGQILGWVDAYYKFHKYWPTERSGPIDGVPGETWRSVNDALYLGRRGFPGGSSVAKLLDEYRRDVWYPVPQVR